MDEKTLKDKLRELVEDILRETFCGQCGFNFHNSDLEIEDPDAVEAILEELAFEIIKE